MSITKLIAKVFVNKAIIAPVVISFLTYALVLLRKNKLERILMTEKKKVQLLLVRIALFALVWWIYLDITLQIDSPVQGTQMAILFIVLAFISSVVYFFGSFLSKIAIQGRGLDYCFYIGLDDEKWIIQKTTEENMVILEKVVETKEESVKAIQRLMPLDKLRELIIYYGKIPQARVTTVPKSGLSDQSKKA